MIDAELAAIERLRIGARRRIVIGIAWLFTLPVALAIGLVGKRHATAARKQ